MVEDRITDGTRIAELLASELTGLQRTLEAVELTDVDKDATPSSTGTTAYYISFEGIKVAAVNLSPEHVSVTFRTAYEPDDDTVEGPDLELTGDTLTISSGAAVKRALDCIRQTLERTEN